MGTRGPDRTIGTRAQMELSVANVSGRWGGVSIRSTNTQTGVSRSLRIHWEDVLALSDALVDLVEQREARGTR